MTNAIGPGSVEAPAFGPDPRREPVQREWQEQKTDNAFLSKALPPDAYFTAIDHARKMTAAHGKMRKDRGIRAGLPDWLIVYRGITLWIERKAGASLSDHQKTTREALLRNGHYWALARSTEEVEQACRNMGIPLRATLGEIRGRIAEQNARIKPARKRSGGGFGGGGGSKARVRKGAAIYAAVLLK